MDKRKLVQIILKDLDELKLLSEEVAEIQDDVTLIVDLALSKARLLCQEIELLHEYSGKTKKTSDVQSDSVEIPEEEESEVTFSEPELEILHFDVPDLEENLPETEDKPEFSDEDEQEDQPEGEIDQDDVPDEEDIETDPLEESDLLEIEPEEEKEEEKSELPEQEDENEEEIIVYDEDKDEEEEIIVYDEEEDEEEENSDLEDETETEHEIQITELDNEPEVREIHIDELDDEDSDSFKFSPLTGSTDRPIMHEIPKPESASKEKQVIGDTFRKERSLNDAIGENKSGESKLINGPIASLRASIGLNDRFLFIREIFSNNAEKYNTVIDQLDKLETIQQAVEYLKANLSLEKNETSMKFVDLLKRRFNK